MKLDFDAAARDLALAESAQSPTAELRQAQCLLARDRDERSAMFSLIQEVQRLDPKNGDYANGSGLVYLSFGRFVEADQFFIRAAEIQQSVSSIPLWNRVNLRAIWRGPAAALRLLDRAPPGFAGRADLRSDLLVELGRIDEARALIEKNDQELAGRDTSPDKRNVRFVPEQLLAVGLEDVARRRAVQDLPHWRRQFESGNHAPNVFYRLVTLATIAGDRDAARAWLDEWRREAQKLPKGIRREADFRGFAALCCARLGLVDEALAILQETAAEGFHYWSLVRSSRVWTPGKEDPRLEAYFEKERAWAATLPEPVDP